MNSPLYTTTVILEMTHFFAVVCFYSDDRRQAIALPFGVVSASGAGAPLLPPVQLQESLPKC
jgi:hypothetical protein